MTSPPPKTWLVRLEQGATFLFLVYVLVLLGRSAFLNAERNQQTAHLRAEIENLKQKIVELNELNAYQQTTTFKELEARQKMGLKKPGEIVIALPPEPDSPVTINGTAAPNVTPTYLVLKAWWNYYFSE